MSTKASRRPTEISTAEAKTRFCELVRRVEVSGDSIAVTRRGKVVARLVPADESAEKPRDWLDVAWGLCADAPEVTEAIDEAFRSRQHDVPRPLRFPWDGKQ